MNIITDNDDRNITISQLSIYPYRTSMVITDNTLHNFTINAPSLAENLVISFTLDGFESDLLLPPNNIYRMGDRIELRSQQTYSKYQNTINTIPMRTLNVVNAQPQPVGSQPQVTIPATTVTPVHRMDDLEITYSCVKNDNGNFEISLFSNRNIWISSLYFFDDIFATDELSWSVNTDFNGRIVNP